MALIKNTKGRRVNQSPGGYTRILGNAELGNLMSRVHGTVNSAGNELERLIIERCRPIADLDIFLSDITNNEPGIFVATKNQVKHSEIISSRYEPDFLTFNLVTRTCYVIEVKDGDQFDTKKAAAEHTSLHNFTTDVAQALPFSVQTFICSFNARTREEIYEGLKHKFSLAEILTGQELCELLGVDFEEIINIRVADQLKNLDFFVDEILKIPEVKAKIVERLEK